MVTAMLSFRLSAFTLALAVTAPTPAFAWEQISKEEGITVWQRKVEGTSLVEFRGRGVVNGSFKKILAVLHDPTRKTEWMDSCVANRRVRALGPGHAIFYNRTGSSFPLVADRDVVLESMVAIWRDKKQVKVDVYATEDPDVPPVSGVVRMPSLRASWVLIAQSPTQTEVTYQVQADPGGSLPAWVVNLVAKKIPFKTIANLRKQVKKDGYEEDLAYVERSFDWSGFFDSPAPPAILGPAGGGQAAAAE